MEAEQYGQWSVSNGVCADLDHEWSEQTAKVETLEPVKKAIERTSEGISESLRVFSRPKREHGNETEQEDLHQRCVADLFIFWD